MQTKGAVVMGQPHCSPLANILGVWNHMMLMKTIEDGDAKDYLIEVDKDGRYVRKLKDNVKIIQLPLSSKTMEEEIWSHEDKTEPTTIKGKNNNNSDINERHCGF